MYEFKILEPSTVYFNSPNITVFFDNGKIFHVQTTSNNITAVKFPIMATFKSASKPLSIKPGIKYPKSFKLPQKDRNFNKHLFKIVLNPQLKHTPARIFYETGVCEVSPDFLKMPYQYQQFILEHEKAHFFYSDEQAADLCALYTYGRKGFNLSQAFYCLDTILKPSNLKENRVSNIINTIRQNEN